MKFDRLGRQIVESVDSFINIQNAIITRRRVIL